MANKIYVNFVIKGDNLFEEIITNEWMNEWMNENRSNKKTRKHIQLVHLQVQIDALANSH